VSLGKGMLYNCVHSESMASRVLKHKTPEETFTGEKPQVSHFHVFGCPVYIHVPNEKRTKFEP